MFKIETAEVEPEWITLQLAIGDMPAVRMLMRPAETAMIIAGRQAVARLEEPQHADINFAFTAGAVAWGAMAWEGIGNTAGEPLPLTEANVFALLRQRQPAFDQLDREYVTPMLLRDEEKNASALLPPGGSGRARTTAKGAAQSSVKSARRSSTNRKPKPVDGSGAS